MEGIGGIDFDFDTKNDKNWFAQYTPSSKEISMPPLSKNPQYHVQAAQHELGHHVWHNVLSQNQRDDWLRHYLDTWNPPGKIDYETVKEKFAEAYMANVMLSYGWTPGDLGMGSRTDIRNIYVDDVLAVRNIVFGVPVDPVDHNEIIDLFHKKNVSADILADDIRSLLDRKASRKEITTSYVDWILRAFEDDGLKEIQDSYRMAFPKIEWDREDFYLRSWVQQHKDEPLDSEFLLRKLPTSYSWTTGGAPEGWDFSEKARKILQEHVWSYTLQDQIDDREGDLIDQIKKFLIGLVGVNVSQAVNEGRQNAFDELQGQIGAYQWSAILDKRTCKTCKYLDGMYFSADDPLLQEIIPGLHSHCRCILVGILKEELEAYPVEIHRISIEEARQWTSMKFWVPTL